MRKCVLKEDIWQWPEFQSFAKRIGINLENSIRDLTIRICDGDIVTVEQEFFVTEKRQVDTPHPDKML